VIHAVAAACRPPRQGTIGGDGRADRRSLMSETPLESPSEDVAEQQLDAFPDAAAGRDAAETSLEVDPADAQEQAAEVPLDEDAWP